MNVRYRVELSQAEREELTAMPAGGKHAAGVPQEVATLGVHRPTR